MAAHTPRVLILVENLSVPFDRRVWRQCQALQKAGYEVTVICPAGKKRDRAWREDIEGVSIYRYRAYEASRGVFSYIAEYSVALFFLTFLTLYVALRRGFDVIQICNPPDLLILIAAWYRVLGKKVIFDQHDLSPEIFAAHRPLTAPTGFLMHLLLFFERLTYSLSDTVMVVNESCRKIALERGRKRGSDVFVVRNGPASTELAAARPNPALKNGKTYLLCYVGIMNAQEGVDLLLRALQRLRYQHRRSDFRARLIGGGPVLDSMSAYAVELGLADVVTFTGVVPHHLVMEEIASADLCLCPDPKTPLSDRCTMAKVIEYMGIGKPFVSFDLQEVRLAAGEAGLYATANDEADFADKVNILLNDADARERMGAVGRKRVLESLTWEHSVKQLYAAYEHSLGFGAERTVSVESLS